MDDDKALAQALGLKTAYGFHLEGDTRLPARERRSPRWYPCIELDHTYTGCLGAACPLEVCWTGTASTGYSAGLQHQFHAAVADYVPRARCLHCSHVKETTVEAIDGRGGVIDLPMLQCENQCWQNPISASSFVRRRIPPKDERDLAECPLFEQASAPIAIVEHHRLSFNDRVRARRAAKVTHSEQNG